MGTKDKGILFKPDKNNFNINCFVDADFAGQWYKHDPDDSISVRSRTGFVTKLAGVPLIWLSKLQSKIALSTTEAEYMALSHSLREMIPCRELLHEIGPLFGASTVQLKTQSTVFEDNQSAIELAMCPKLRPRTKCIATEYHHFRESVTNKEITVEYISTKLQEADIFTKALTRVQFQELSL